MQPDQQSNYRPRSDNDDEPQSDSPSPLPYAQPVEQDADQPTPVISLTRGVVSPVSTGENKPAESTTTDTDEPIRWQAKEHLEHDKNASWFLGLAGITVLLMALSIFLMRSWSFTVLIAVMAVAVVVYAKRPPRIIDYMLGKKGLHVNDRLYLYNEFKAFGIIKDVDQYFVLLIPTKRFAPGVSVYFPEEVGEQIVDTLGSRLPMQEYKLDFIDRLVRKLRL